MLTYLRPMLKKIAEGNRIGRLLAPAGLGGHLDHLVVRQQALALADCLGAGPTHVGFYEDLPYAAFAPPGGRGRWILAAARAPALARKQAALLAFATRLRSTDIAATMAFTASSGGEYSLTNPVESQAAWLASSP